MHSPEWGVRTSVSFSSSCVWGPSWNPRRALGFRTQPWSITLSWALEPNNKSLKIVPYLIQKEKGPSFKLKPRCLLCFSFLKKIYFIPFTNFQIFSLFYFFFLGHHQFVCWLFLQHFLWDLFLFFFHFSRKKEKKNKVWSGISIVCSSSPRKNEDTSLWISIFFSYGVVFLFFF